MAPPMLPYEVWPGKFLNTLLDSLEKARAKVLDTKEREEKEDTPASLSSHDLKRLGLTPGSYIWKLLLGIDDSGEQKSGT